MKLIATTLVLTITTLLGGCGVSGALYVDRNFTTEEQLEIQAAANMWAAVGAPVDIVWNATVPSWESRRELVRASHAQAVRLDPEFLTPGTTGRWDGTSRLIVDMDRIQETRDSLKLTTAHEMGHMLGLHHVTAGDAVMNAVRRDDSPTELTVYDVAELRRVEAFGSP